MKQILLLAFLLSAGSASSQWFQQYSDEYHYYNTIFFTDSLNGWVGGYPYSGDPFTLKTTDGGINWEMSLIGSTTQSIYFTDISTGFCAAYNGIYKSTDGGDSWIQNYPDSVHYNSIEFTDENNGWAIGEYSETLYLVKTTDGGLSWTKSVVADGIDPKIEMINELTGFIITENSPKIRKTADGGNNWFVVYDDSSNEKTLWDISFSDELNGFACGVQSFLFTTDGGNKWVKKNIPLTFCDNILSMSNQCWVSGFGIGYYAIIYTDDYGNTWTPIFVDDSTRINDFFFSDVNTGWFSSIEVPFSAPLYNGFIYKIKKGWTEDITSPSTPQQIYPENDSFFEENFFYFEWEKLDYSLYRLQISSDSLFTNFFVITNQSTGDTAFIGNNLYVENNPLVGFYPNKKYYWRVRAENKSGISDWSETWSFTTSSPNDIKEENVPTEFKLFQNYPNPFNPITNIGFRIANFGFVSLKVYDVLGREIATLVNEEKPAGEYEVVFNAENLSSGFYFYTLKTDNFSETTKKLLLMK